jgi:hypothetical protein
MLVSFQHMSDRDLYHTLATATKVLLGARGLGTPCRSMGGCKLGAMQPRCWFSESSYTILVFLDVYAGSEIDALNDMAPINARQVGATK